MALPWNFFMNSGCRASYYPSMITYDMCNGSLMSSMNLHWNQGISDYIARMSLYNVPQYNFTNFTQYATPMMTNSYLLDPMYTLGQMDWQYRSQYGTGLFQAPNMNGIFGWNPSGNVNGGGSTTTEGNDDATKRKVTNLRNFLNTVKKNSGDNDLKDKITDTLNSVSRDGRNTAAKQYEYLKNFYNENIRNNITTHMMKFKVDNEFIDQRLCESGYEGNTGCENAKKIDDTIAELDRVIENAYNMDTKAKNPQIKEKHQILGSLANMSDKDYPILDVISSWNTRFKDDSTKRNIITRILNEAAQNSGDSSFKKDLVENSITPLVDSLVRKANSVVNEKVGDTDVLKSTTKDKINEAIRNINKNLENKNYNEVANNFDELYVLLRKATATIEGAKLEKEFGYLEDTAVFNKDMFMNKTNEDLEAEGLSDIADDIEIGVNENIGKKQSSTPKTAAEEMNRRIEANEVEALEGVEATKAKTDLRAANVTVNDGDEILVETKGNNKKVYIRNGETVTEVTNVTVDENGNITKVQGGAVTTVEQTPEEVEQRSKENKKEEKAQEEAASLETQRVRAYNNGSRVYELIDGDTEDWKYNNVNELISSDNLNKNNIVEFLNGFYIHDSHEGIIEFLDDEHDDGKIKLENKVNIINSLIERAKEAGIDENQISGLLKDVVAHTSDYTGGWFGGKNCFNKDAEPWWKITLRNAIPGTFGCFGGTLDTITYNEVIDEEMKKLHAEIKAKEAQQAEQAQQA